MIEHVSIDEVRTIGIEQCQRVFHGRGKAYPGWQHVTVDWLPPVILLTLYEELDASSLYRIAEGLRNLFPECASLQVKYRCRAKSPYEVLWGEHIEQLTVAEDALKYNLFLGRSQNMGLFLDMRHGRQWVREHARDKRVLNLFAYTCGFSVAAIAGGAEHVVNVDVSKAALSRGRDNHRLNQHDLAKVTFEGVNILKSYARLKKYAPYDVLICDPPQFQKGRIDIKRDYAKILRRVPDLLSPSASMVLCLNSPELGECFLHDLVDDVCPQFSFKLKINPPEVFRDLEPDRGLKTLIFES